MITVAPYLSEPDDEVASPEVTPAPEPEGEAVAVAAPVEAQFEPEFGKDGSLIKPVDKTDIGEDGTLPYENIRSIRQPQSARVVMQVNLSYMPSIDRAAGVLVCISDGLSFAATGMSCSQC